jgi:hypothetical protein
MLKEQLENGIYVGTDLLNNLLKTHIRPLQAALGDADIEKGMKVNLSLKFFVEGQNHKVEAGLSFVERKVKVEWQETYLSSQSEMFPKKEKPDMGEGGGLEGEGQEIS